MRTVRALIRECNLRRFLRRVIGLYVAVGRLRLNGMNVTRKAGIPIFEGLLLHRRFGRGTEAGRVALGQGRLRESDPDDDTAENQI